MFELQETTQAVATLTTDFICTIRIVKWPQVWLRGQEDAWGKTEGHPVVLWWKKVRAGGAAIPPWLQVAHELTEPEQP